MPRHFFIALLIAILGGFFVASAPVIKAGGVRTGACSPETKASGVLAEPVCDSTDNTKIIGYRNYQNIRKPFFNPETGNPEFEYYLNAVLSRYLPFILFIAMVMIVYSGVQYMLSGFNPEAQKLAKQRILGILGGLIFYLLIQLILNQLLPTSDIGLKINTTP